MPCREDLLAFERTPETLHENLFKLQQAVEEYRPEYGSFVDFFEKGDEEKNFLGTVYRLPKSIKKKKPETPKGHFERVTDILPNDYKAENYAADKQEIRYMAKPSIEFQVLGVLWAMERGAERDSQRSDNSRAYVLRRQKEDCFPNDEPPQSNTETEDGDTFKDSGKGSVNMTYPGLYQPYYKAYRNWRSDGLKACRQAIQQNKRVFAMSMDIRRFYHRIDARCLNELSGGNPLGKIEKAFYDTLKDWQSRNGESPKENGTKLGIPVGLIASGLVANLVLDALDQSIEQAMVPIYYGRYVDDLFLVIELPGKINDAESVYERIGEHLKHSRCGPRVQLEIPKDGDYLLKSDKWGESHFVLKPEKQKCFLLKGTKGEDLLKVIDQDLKKNSSEWRMVPDLVDSDEILLKETLSLGDVGDSEIVTLRDADSLSLRRLGVSVNLRRLELMERFRLNSTEWIEYRKSYYRFARDHILTPEGLTDYLSEIPRIFGLAFAQSDWSGVVMMLKKMKKSIEVVNRIFEAEYPWYSESTDISDFLYRTLSEQFISASPKRRSTRIASAIIDEINKLNSNKQIGNIENDDAITEAIKLYRDHDLSRESASIALMRRKPKGNCKGIEEAADCLQEWAQRHSGDIHTVGDAFKLLFSTRPLGALEASMLLTNEDFDLRVIKKWLRISRGYLYPTKEDKADKETKAPSDHHDEPRALYSRESVIKLTSNHGSSPVRIAVTNYKTELKSWDCSVRGTPDHSLDRLRNLLSLVDAFLRKTKDESWIEKPLYFVLPELSVPTDWLYPLAKIFAYNDISLIVGGEYEHSRKDGILENPAYLFLRTIDLGFPATIAIKQTKTEAAQQESRDMWDINHSWIKTKDENEIEKSLPVYQHGNLFFGVVLCSELSNSQIHHRFRGLVDAVFCLEWNQDIETYSTLVEASSYSIHAYMIQVNNRYYGDSRIRVPAKERYNRDKVRLLGGEHDYYVVGEVDFMSLRDFQRNQHSDQSIKAKYKPTPSGFNPKLYTQRLGGPKPNEKDEE